MLLSACTSGEETPPPSPSLDALASEYRDQQNTIDSFEEEQEQAKALKWQSRTRAARSDGKCPAHPRSNLLSLRFPFPVAYPYRVLVVMDTARAVLICDGLSDGSTFVAGEQVDVMRAGKWVRTRIPLLDAACRKDGVSIPLVKVESRKTWSDAVPKVYRVLVLDRAGQPLVRERFRASYAVREPDGPGCGKVFTAEHSLGNPGRYHAARE